MKRFLAVILLSVLALTTVVRADGPDDDYVAVYSLIQQGDALSEKGDTGAALNAYVQAQGALKRFQTMYPDTYVKVVQYRMNYLNDQIQKLSNQTPSAKPAASNSQPQSSFTAPVSGIPTTSPEMARLENQVKNLEAQVQELEGDRSTLQAKLKEALAARPAEVDPQELAKAREQILSLEKENELLKANIETAKTNAAVAAIVPAELERTRQALADANRKLLLLADDNTTLKQEKDTLQQRMKTLGVAEPAAAALRQENELLKKQVAELQRKPASAAPTDALQKKLQEAEAQIAAMQSDKEIMRLEKIALEDKVKQLVAQGQQAPSPATTNGSAAPVSNANSSSPQATDSATMSKIAQLEAQRDELQKSLEAATHDALGRRKGKAMAARLEDMSRELAALRARVVVFEATAIPYTPEEKALFSAPAADISLSATAHASAHAARRPAKEPPPAAALLLSEGRQYFVNKQYDLAESKYEAALKMDPDNIGILSDLASIQLESGQLADAEKNIKAALAGQPDDDYSLFVLGQLKFREKQYDDAFDALSRAAQLNPTNARVQNSLGLTLSEKGLRGPAETAFRKAIQLDPSFADAHMNLAVVYATQTPPLLELARWHYQKALAAGHAPSPDLERMLNPNRSAAR